MSRPIYEPSLPRADAALGYGSRQLFRRPAPTGGANLMPRFVGYLDHSITVATANETTIGLDAWQNDDPVIFDVDIDGAGDAIGMHLGTPGLYSFNALFEYSTNFNAAHGVLLVDTVGNEYPGTPNYGAYNPTFDGVQFVYPPVLSFIRGVPLWPTPDDYAAVLVSWEWRVVQYSGINRSLVGGFVEIIRLGDIGQFPASS